MSVTSLWQLDDPHSPTSRAVGRSTVSCVFLSCVDGLCPVKPRFIGACTPNGPGPGKLTGGARLCGELDARSSCASGLAGQEGKYRIPGGGP